MRNGSWKHTTLGTLLAARGKSVDPSKYPNDFFELYSVPSFPERKPEIIAGKEIGSNKQEVHPRSVLLCKINPRINRVWVVGNLSPRPKIASTEWIVFPESAAIAPEFLCFFLQQNSVRDFLAAHASGVGGSLMRVKPSTLRDFPFSFPDRDEQERIVAELEKQFTRLDAGLGSLEKAQTGLKRYTASVLNTACEGRLVQAEAEAARQERRRYETGDQLLQRILTQRRERWRGKGKYKEPQSIKVADSSPLPDGWVWATVEQLNPADRPCAYGVLQPGPNVEDGIPIVRVGDINNGRVDQTNLKRISPTIASRYPRSNLQGGEVVISLVGAIGRTAVIPQTLFGANTARAVGIIPLTELVDPNWVEIWFRNPRKVSEMTSKSHEVARKTLNLEDVRAASVALPPTPEQARIVPEVHKRSSIVDDVEKITEFAIRRADLLRSSILQQSFAEASRRLDKPVPAPAAASSIDSDLRIPKPSMMKTSKPKRSLINVLIETKRTMTPEELFHAAGFTEADIDAFFEELKHEEASGRIQQIRPDETAVLLTAGSYENR